MTSKHLVMSRRTAIEGLFNYSGRGGEAGRGKERRKKSWLLGQNRYNEKCDDIHESQDLVLGHFQFAAKVLFSDLQHPPPLPNGVFSVTPPFFPSLIISSCLLETAAECCGLGGFMGTSTRSEIRPFTTDVVTCERHSSSPNVQMYTIDLHI